MLLSTPRPNFRRYPGSPYFSSSLKPENIEQIRQRATKGV
jgi:hypothetical protein